MLNKQLSGKITVFAPGKLMLLGEHAVVYGYPCLVAALDKYLSVSVSRTETGQDVIITPQVKEQSFLKKTLEVFRNTFKIKEKIYLETESNLGNFGLGSSAAVTVAALKALSLFFGINLNKEQLFKLAYKIVLSLQGKASGFDLAAAIFGGTIYFDGQTKTAEKITDEELPIVVGFSGEKAKTVEMIGKVDLLRQKEPKLVESLFLQIKELAEEAKIALQNKEWINLGKLFNQNFSLLQKLDVSTVKLDKMVTASLEAGAWGAKLSGAGGGDCLIALVSAEKKKRVEEAIIKTGGQIIKLKVGSGRGCGVYV